MVKIYIHGWLHHKNLHALQKGLGNLLVGNIDEADCVYSPTEYIDVSLYPDKKFIFGPHFSVFPNEASRKLINDRSVYIQPSDWARDVWVNDYNFKNVPVLSYAFGVDTDLFKPSENGFKDGVIVYHKQRTQEELNLVTKFLDSKGIKYEIYSYGSYYEGHYIESLKRAKYCVWIGRHESQGFALEECLSSGVPVLVWDVSKMSQECGCPQEYHNVKTVCTACPYWDERCGEKFTHEKDFEPTFQTFIEKLDDAKSYNPRAFILENLTIKKQTEEFLKIFKDL
jgi:hypothetical protein